MDWGRWRLGALRSPDFIWFKVPPDLIDFVLLVNDAPSRMLLPSQFSLQLIAKSQSRSGAYYRTPPMRIRRQGTPTAAPSGSSSESSET